MKKIRERYKLLKRDQGTAIILSLVIVSVLFILTSFLVRKVLTNTTMVEKTGKEQESYALAKQGILYAVDQLNTAEGYDPTDWTPNEVEQGNWSDYSNYSLMVYKDHIPTSSGYTKKEGYITIESRDLPKKLVSLQGVAEYKNHPLLGYVKFINSDIDLTTGQTFNDTTYGSLIHINGDLTLTDVNFLYLNTDRGDRLEVTGEIKPKVSSTTVTISDPAGNLSNVTLDANNDNTDGYRCGFSRDASGNLLAKEKFDTVYDNIVKNNGRYFDGAHLPSSYDQSGALPRYVTGNALLRWPLINEKRYWDNLNGTTKLADIAIASDDCGKRGNSDFSPRYWWDDRYPSDATHDYGYADIDGSTVDDVYWRREGSATSYNYTPPGVHLIFSATQDLDPSTSGTTERLMRVNDDATTDLPAEYETSASISYSLFTSEDIIFCEKDVRVNAVLPRDLTIVSGGNIYIDSNIYTNGHSLALLAKEDVLLNATHRWVTGYEGDNWNDDGTSAANLAGVTDANVSRAEINKGESLEQILNFGGGTCAQIVTTDRFILRGCNYEVYKDNFLNFTAEVDLGGENWQSLTINSVPAFPIIGPASGSATIVLETPSTPLSFSRIRLTATGDGTGADPVGWVQVDAIEVPITNIDRMAIFAENGSWYIIAGNGASANNDQQESFTLNLAISEQNFEDKSKWDGTDPGLQEATWNDITYMHDSTLAFNPALPPSVNLVSLKRK